MDCRDLHSRLWRAVNRNRIGEPGGGGGGSGSKRGAEGLHGRSGAPILNHGGGLQEINKGAAAR